MEASDRAARMQKWGIPDDATVSAEVTLLERLVWVPYKDQWWPALLYSGYRELQENLYDELDTPLKAQFAVAIMREMNDPNGIKVARLLGREILEIVEVDDTQYAEFYYQLPKVLPMACKKSRYGNDMKLYLDFHRALDQVEEIIRNISENSFHMNTLQEKKSWVERAEESLAVPAPVPAPVPPAPPSPKPRQQEVSSRHAYTPIPGAPPKGSNQPKVARATKAAAVASAKFAAVRNAELMRDKELADEEDSNFLFSALNGMMESLNNTYDCVSGEATQKVLEQPPVIVQQQRPRPTTVHALASSQQQQTRDALRKAIAHQRAIRTKSSEASVPKNRILVADETRNPSMDAIGLRRSSSSTEVLPGLEPDDIFPGITETGVWKFLNSQDENEEDFSGPNPIPTGPSRSYHDQHRSSGYEQPEMTEVMPQKKTVIAVPPAQGHAVVSPKHSMDYREDFGGEYDEREAIKAAARAAAAEELDISFWDHLTCNAMDY